MLLPQLKVLFLCINIVDVLTKVYYNIIIRDTLRRFSIMKREDKYQDTSTFHYANANPKNRITGDCVIRALCTAMNESYDTVYRELFEFSLKHKYMLNDKKCYEKYLLSKGWVKKPQPKKDDNTKYTGREFCQEIQDYTFNYPDRIIAHIGGHHVVAIVGGRVWDIWNSTGGCIGNYYVQE
jgi:hypothetical protein